MKKSIPISVLLAIFLFNYGFGQDSTQNSLKKSKFALQFQIGGSLTLKPFQESSFSGKYHFTDFSAIRAGIQISNSVDIESKIDDVDSLKSNSLSFKINAEYIYYVGVEDDICLFIGGGLAYGRDFYNADGTYLSSDSWNIGLSAIIGMEWFVKKNISLSGEYGIILNYLNRYSTNLSRNVIINQHKTNFNLNSYNQFKIGVSLYL